jgi:uncharacterized membrane protein
MLLLMPEPKKLIEAAGVIYNFALGFSSWHVAVLNTILLPRQLRPHWLIRVGLVLVGIFFSTVGAIALFKLLNGDWTVVISIFGIVAIIALRVYVRVRAMGSTTQFE